VSELGDAIWGTVADLLGLPAVGLAGRVLVIMAFVLWLAAAWWTWRDAGARSEDQLLPYVATAGIVLATPVLFVPALAVYLLLRPRLLLGRDHDLELRVAAIRSGERPDRCPACEAPLAADWRRCPRCATTLAAPCPACGRMAGMDWRLCAWCAADLPWAPEPAGQAATDWSPVAIPIVPGGRPWVPVMAVPEAAASTAPDTGTPHDPGGDRTVRRVVRGRPRHRRGRGGWFVD
jgi:hypothetical protein